MFAKTALGRDFKKLWAALTISLMGSEITRLALPLFAALTLGATPLQMGILSAAGQVPFLLCSLPAGVVADRTRRRPILVIADLGSAILLLSVPLAVPFGGPSFAQLCVVAFGVGAFLVFSEVAHYAYVPTLVGREHLTECNSRLQISYSASEAGGPGLAGVIIQVLSAPLAVLADAASFLVSALLLRSVRHDEPRPGHAEPPVSLRRSLTDGLRILFGHRLLRPIIISGVIITLFENGMLAIYVLYATRELGLNPLTIGLIFAAGGIGAIPGAMLARWAGTRFGLGPAIIGGLILTALASLLVPLATGPMLLVVVLLGSAKAFGAITFTVANIHQWSLRQAVTPDNLAGRVTASQRFIVYGGGSLGSLLGGALGTTFGLRPALFICAIGFVLAPLYTLFSPLRGLREQPTEAASADTIPPDAMSGGAVPDDAMPDDAIPREAVPGKAIPGEAVPGDDKDGSRLVTQREPGSEIPNRSG
jgi:MFS family permease